MKYVEDSKTTLGFWMYLMTDCVIFACLFATYAVLRNSTFGGVEGGEIFNLPYVLLQTIILLTSSLVAGLMILAVRRRQKSKALTLLTVTMLLGVSFLALEIHEFRQLIAEGNGPQSSAFLSAFFTLVGTHGLHIFIGLLWALFLWLQLYSKKLNQTITKRLFLFSLFWHFLDIVWIFIFTFVYLMGVVL